MILAALALAAAAWTPHPSEGVDMHIASEGRATRIDFDFHQHAGYAIARRHLDLDLPPNYQFVWRIKGDAPSENLEFKLLRGDNVWWLNRRDFVFPRAWTTLKTKKRQIGFAWGPAGGGEITHVDDVEIVVTAGSGGKGTVWFDDFHLEPLPPTPTEPLTFKSSAIDFDAKREIGGLMIDWVTPAKQLRVYVDGVLASRVARASLPAPPGAPARMPAPHGSDFVWLPDAEAKSIRIVGGRVRQIVVEPPAWAPTVNDFWSIVAKASKRGDYPRYLIGEQPYWTVVGDTSSNDEILVGEDGNIEPFKGGYSIEPFLDVGGKRLTWADVKESQSLRDGYLPIPSVTWKHPDATMTITVDGNVVTYRVKAKHAKLTLAYRPFQVNPSTQFLNGEGGYSTMPRPPDRNYKIRGDRTITLRLPVPLKKVDWREQLNRVPLDTPPRIANTIRTSLAYILIHRDGAALQPGSRAYERSWIRDGALMAPVLLRLGHVAEAREFAEWFATFQYPSGKIPCCVDRRGADPVPENDSHGEFIFLVAEVYRTTHDVEFVKRMWPHVEAAARYINELRAANHGEFEGLVTESISHEGYSAKAVHSYWDDFFALKGLRDAAMLAKLIGKSEFDDDAARMQRDLRASIDRVIAAHHLDFIPGSAELADFDPSATAIAVAPLGLADVLPQEQLRNTFAKYLATPHGDLYTPYEMRIIDALIALGDTSHTAQLVDFFLADQRPRAWNEWAEVVRKNPRAPGFIGDMPHAWIASDFVRAVLDAIDSGKAPASWQPILVRGIKQVH